MAAKKPQWVANGETMYVKELPQLTLVVEQIKMSGHWRAEYFTSPKWGRLQIDRVSTPEEAKKVCDEFASRYTA
jgi:hypothetical protein